MIHRQIAEPMRMIEIIKSMRSPQVRYEVQHVAHNFTYRLHIQAVNKHGICFYECNKEMGIGSTSKKNFTLLEMHLNHMPREWFVNEFITFENSI